VGVDSDEALLARARGCHPGVRFEHLDVRALGPASFGIVDGIWSSFTAAYLAELGSVVSRWRECLAPGGWLALVEVDDLLGHEPLSPTLRAKIDEFYALAAADGRYDFRCGRGLAGAVGGAGLTVEYDGSLPDAELSFAGSAREEVIEAWQQRFARMHGLRDFFGAGFAEFERGFFASLRSPAHRSLCEVRLVVARCPR
jgi:hypothetical protein